MNIYAQQGAKVIYTGCSDEQCSGMFGGSNDDPRPHLTEGETYEVSYTKVRDWSSDVYLKGFESYGFNTVCFIDKIDYVAQDLLDLSEES